MFLFAFTPFFCRHAFIEFRAFCEHETGETSFKIMKESQKMGTWIKALPVSRDLLLFNMLTGPR